LQWPGFAYTSQTPCLFSTWEAVLIQRLEEDDATWRGEMGAQALGEWVLLRLCLLSKHKTLELLELRSCSRVAKEEEPDVDSGDEDPCGSFGRNQPLNRRY